jgi:purine-binding chemotaxis protein CheW
MDSIETVTRPYQGPASESPSATVTSRRVCLISLANELFAIDLRSVREVFEVESVTPVPGMPQMLIGVANLRGTVIPLADLRPAFGLPVAGPELRYAVVLRYGSQQVGVLVDTVPEILNVHPNEFLNAPAHGTDGARPFVTSILRVADRMSGVVEVQSLMTCVEQGGGG